MMRSVGTVVQRRTVAGVVNGTSSSPSATYHAASSADRAPTLATAASSSSLSAASAAASALASSCFDRIGGSSNSSYDHHRRRKRRQHYHDRGAYYTTCFGIFVDMQKFRVVGQWTAVFVVIYLATLLMTHGYQDRSSLQKNNESRTSTSATTAATSRHRHHHHRNSNINDIAFPTSLMIHNGENYHQQQQQQRSHHRRYHHSSGGDIKNLRQHHFYYTNNDGSIRPLPPLPRPHQRDDDYTEPNFGDLDLYMLSEYDKDEDENDDDGYYEDEQHEHTNRVVDAASTRTQQRMLRREILEENWRLDPDRFEHEFQRHGRPRPHYDDYYYDNDQYIPDVDKYPENEYYWYYAMDDDVKRNPYIGYVVVSLIRQLYDYAHTPKRAFIALSRLDISFRLTHNAHSPSLIDL
jgi:hypothetical protein